MGGVAGAVCGAGGREVVCWMVCGGARCLIERGPHSAGTLGAFLVGGANPAVGLVLVKCIKVLFLVDPDEVRAQALLWCIPLFLVSVGQMFGDTMRGWGFGKPGEKLTVKVRMMFYKALVRQEVGWHDLPSNAAGALCASLATEVNMVQALSGETLGRSVVTIMTIIVNPQPSALSPQP